MDLKRFFTDKKVNGDSVTLSGAEFLHITKVCRAKAGYKFILCDDGDIDYYCCVLAVEKDYLTAAVEKAVKNETADGMETALFIGVCKELDAVVQKAVELGVSILIPFFSRHTNVSSVNTERLRRIVLESSKQSGRSRLMEVCEPVSFSEAVRLGAQFERKLFFYEFERENKAVEYLTSKGGNIAVFIGSEGGFAAEESRYAAAHKFEILTLGTRILRVETAVAAALTLCLHGDGRI